MLFRMAKAVAIAAGMASLILASPSQSQAGLCDWLFGCGRTTYRPLFYGAGTCDPCGQTCSPCATQTCNYVPQTCYRTECVNVPVTTYRPCQSCDPCTGCPVTTYRPVTSLVRQVRYVPYTSYRQVCSPCATPAPCATGCAPAAVAPVATTYYPTTLAPAAPAANCCTPAATTLSAPPAGYLSAPAGQVIQGSPTMSSPLPATPVPSLNGGSGLPQTYDPNATPQAIPDRSLNNGASGTINWQADPNSRTTSLPRASAAPARSSLVLPAVYLTPKSDETLDVDGWRAARP